MSNIWMLFVIVGLVTLLLRASFLGWPEKVALPEGIGRALRYVPPAVFSALVASGLASTFESDIETGAPRLIAAAVGALVVWRTESVALTIALGMVVLWVASAVAS